MGQTAVPAGPLLSIPSSALQASARQCAAAQQPAARKLALYPALCPVRPRCARRRPASLVSWARRPRRVWGEWVLRVYRQPTSRTVLHSRYPGISDELARSSVVPIDLYKVQVVPGTNSQVRQVRRSALMTSRQFFLGIWLHNRAPKSPDVVGRESISISSCIIVSLGPEDPSCNSSDQR